MACPRVLSLTSIPPVDTNFTFFVVCGAHGRSLSWFGGHAWDDVVVAIWTFILQCVSAELHPNSLSCGCLYRKCMDTMTGM